jgi:glycosyltransferase involved in cell wall biosynthesis
VRILYFTRDYTPHDHRFLTALAQTEHQIYYLQLEKRGHALDDRPLPPEIEQVHWSGGRAPVSLRDGPGLRHELKSLLRQLKPDLVQAGPIQRSAFLVALAGFKPLLSMSWGYDLLIDAERNTWWRRATRFTLKRSAVLVGDCQTIRQKAIAYGMPDEKIHTFPWGIDLQAFAPPETPSQPSPWFTLLSTRSWEPVYGVDLIARAFVHAAQKNAHLRLIMLGNGSQAAWLHQTFQQGGVHDRVIFPGQVSQAELPHYYHMADLYISASYSDGTSISLLEALACGRLAVVSDIPGNCEWITPGVNGWLFPAGDAHALANAIMTAQEQRTKFIEMGRAARTLVEERADWKINFPKLLEAYEAAILSP